MKSVLSEKIETHLFVTNYNLQINFPFELQQIDIQLYTQICVVSNQFTYLYRP